MKKYLLPLLFLSLFFVSFSVVLAQTIELKSCGELKTSGAYYILMNDVESDGDCFSILQPDITLDLNGHTITYGNSQETGSYNAISCYMYGRRGIRVFNGTIIQGSGSFSQYWSAAVGCGANDSEYSNLNIIVHGAYSPCISIGRAYNASVHDNFCYIANRSNYKGNGIEMGGAGTSRDSIYNNIIVGSNRGIHIENGADFLDIHHNLIQNYRNLGTKSPQGIYMGGGGFGNRIHHNQLVSDFARGIKISGWNNTLNDNIIDVQYSRRAVNGIGSQPYPENRCYGVWSRQGGNTTFHNNKIIVDNSVLGDSSSGVYGITIYGEPDWDMHNNTVIVHHQDTTRYAIALHMSEAYGVNCDNMNITNNRLIGYTGAASLEDGSNIYFVNNEMTRPVNHSPSWFALDTNNVNGITEPNQIIYDEDDGTAPSMPTGLAVKEHKWGKYWLNELRWNFNPESDMLGYRIYRDGEPLVNDDCLSLRGGNFFIDTDGGKHCYGVSAVDIYGHESGILYQDSCTSCIDNDGDGYGIGASCLGSDCNDNDAGAHALMTCSYNGSECGEFEMCVSQCPAPPQETCNGFDDNCNGEIDEGYSEEECSFVCIANGGGWSQSGFASGGRCCGDSASEGKPYETRETFCCDGKDNDCDGNMDSQDPDCYGSSCNGRRECENWQTNHPDWIFCDDFENSSTDDYDGGWREYITYIDKRSNSADNVLEGNKSIQATITPRVNSAAGIYKFFSGQDGEVYARWYAKFADDYYDQGHMHFVTLQGLDTSKPCGCSGCCSNTRPNGDDRFLSALEFTDNGTALLSRIYSYFYNQRNPSPSYRCCPKPLSTWARDYSPETPFYIEKGSWHSMELMIHPNTPGRDDGYQAYWIDGKLVMNITHSIEKCGPYTNSPYSSECENDDPSVDVYQNFYDNPPPYTQEYPPEGFIWRTTSNLKLNNIWLEVYNHLAGTNPRPNRVWFDNLVVSRNYIGPLECANGLIRAACYCGGEPSPRDSSNVHTSGYCCNKQWQQFPCEGEMPADTNHNGKIETAELLAFINRWKTEREISLAELINAIRAWKGLV